MFSKNNYLTKIYFFFIFFLKKKKNFFYYTLYFFINIKRFLDIRKNIRSRVSLKINNREKILIFMPEAIFSSHIEAAIDLWKSLNNHFDVMFVKCFNSLPKCMFKLYYHTNEKNSKISELGSCIKCYKRFDSLSKKYHFNYLDLRKFSIDKINILDKNFYSNKPSDFFKFKYKNIQLAKITLYDYFIINKKNKKNINIQELNVLREIVFNNIKEINFLEKIYREFPFKYVFLVDEYSLQTSIRVWSLKNNIKTFFFQNVPRSASKKNFLEIANIKTWPERIIFFKKDWYQWKNLHIESSAIKLIYEDLALRTKGIGGHIFSQKYSNSKSKFIYEKLNLSPSKKTIGLFTSSDDEETAISQNVNLFNKRIRGEDAFSDQIDWINETIKFVENRNDFQLVIVFHPRLYIGTDLKNSPIFSKIKEMYYNKPYHNVRFVFPDSMISTYNIIEHTDIATVAWSSIGLEISLMGIPVITGLERNFPITPNFNGIFKANSKSIYFKKIIEMKNFNLDFKNLLESIRWYNLVLYGNSNHEQFGSKKNIILNMVKNDMALYDQNLSSLKMLSKKNGLNESNSLKESLFKFKKEFKQKNYNSKLYQLLNKYYNQIN